ncbi:MAG: RES family NAD+ phosphorylase [Pseudomonadales bacterium]|nr:RES family NAD+ phosphorylase [Pseudomonadales bacterium]
MPEAWRVADSEYSATVDDMLSGEGAYLCGGRWNSPGFRIVYLGSSLALAAMELLVHLGRPDIIKRFNKLPVSFNESLVMHINIDDLPSNWANNTMQSSVQDVGNMWAEDKSSLLLEVPSIAVPGDYNYLLNPNHSDLEFLEIGEVTEFEYDPRIVK